MKKIIIVIAIITTLYLPTQALASGMPTFDLQAMLDAATHTQLYKQILGIQQEAEKLQNNIMQKVQDMAGIDKTIQATKEASIKVIDANSPKINSDIEKKIRDINNHIDTYKTPDEQAAAIIKIKAEQEALDKQCKNTIAQLLKARSQNAKDYTTFLSSIKTNKDYKEYEGRIKSYEATDKAYEVQLQEEQTKCDQQAKDLEHDLDITSQTTVMSYNMKMNKEDEERKAWLEKKNAELKKANAAQEKKMLKQ